MPPAAVRRDGAAVAADVEPEREEDLMAVEGVKRPVLLVGMDLRGARIAIAIRATPGALEISGALWISPLRVNSRSHRLATPTSHADGLGKRHSARCRALLVDQATPRPEIVRPGDLLEMVPAVPLLEGHLRPWSSRQRPELTRSMT